ncbi:MAG: hypothetical protein DMG17_04520, partial [Acidobacteria bacterium]
FLVRVFTQFASFFNHLVLGGAHFLDRTQYRPAHYNEAANCLILLITIRNQVSDLFCLLRLQFALLLKMLRLLRLQFALLLKMLRLLYLQFA